MALLNPRVDLAFKKIFGCEENKDLLISLINSIVSPEDQVIDLELLNPYNSRNFIGDKQSILDIKAKDISGNYYDIEMQICNEGDYEERALLCWAKLYADQLKQGDPHSSLRRAIGIHVLNFTSIIDTPDYHNKFCITNQKTGLRFFKHLELHTIELNKFTHSTDENINLILPRIKTGLDRWSAFLTRPGSLNKEHLPKELEDPYIKKALDVLTNTYLNEKEREICQLPPPEGGGLEE
ncbi:MAG: Rpn family recombination-promoting nuclease/putative transposase [Chlamydiota bacterium]